ncbi:glycerophosphodiester phosphodiesterase [Yeosuana sp. MJ-SS3]|uniref:Glycerophosphodiester phosphodiesterase n=1 Tax=Gilvirhabdus luticola TaxID=3079858 RepID=A0ABU3U4N9_9FLAO|nr:glycerophosphodiester phosphodiesterase [Yeosuana sp. MJ-SS3]MDU8885380.1 glycerophosphodiester phosphodiesterase [Yeosuana sp. MJ-SS3]
MSCNEKQEVDIQGHRGCRGLLPENSLPAFKKAIELGVNTLELDLAISKDKQVVVSHEPFMNHLICLDAEGNEISEEDEITYNFYQMTYDSIKQFDCGSKYFERFPKQKKMKVNKPLLSEVFELSEELNSNIRYNIEIKSHPKYDTIFTPKPKEFVNLVLKVINNYNVFNRVNLQSFDVRTLEEIKRQSLKMKVALLVDENESIETKLNSLSFKPEIISPYFKLLNIENVETYQKHGFQIIPWTVNDIDDMNTMIDLNVDGIITDYPDRLIVLINKN